MWEERFEASGGVHLKEGFNLAEHSFQVLMPNSPLLLNYFSFDASFLQDVKVNHRSKNSFSLAIVD